MPDNTHYYNGFNSFEHYYVGDSLILSLDSTNDTANSPRYT